MNEQQLQEITGLFTAMKSGYGELTQEVRKWKSEGDQFAASVREQLGALQGAQKFSGGHRQSLAQTLMESKQLQERPNFSSNMHLAAQFAAKDILNVSQNIPFVDKTVHGGPRQELRFRDLMPSVPVSNAGAVEYIRETAFSNLAAVVAEGALKPKSDKTFVVESLVFKTLAHFFKISRQCWLDLPQLAEALARNLVYGLNYKLEEKLLRGAGGSSDIQGIMPLASPATALPVATPPNTIIDALFSAAAQLTAAGYPPDGGAISPADWGTMRTLKDSTGRYLLDSATPELPRLVVSPFLAAGEWVIGAFGMQSTLYVREEATVATSQFNEDDFVRNLVTMLGEMRVGAAWFQPAAFLKNPAGA